MPVKLAITKRHVITVAIINKTCELMTIRAVRLPNTSKFTLKRNGSVVSYTLAVAAPANRVKGIEISHL